MPEVVESIGIGLDGGSPAIDALTAAFAYRQFFLVLDNFEQILQLRRSELSPAVRACRS